MRRTLVFLFLPLLAACGGDGAPLGVGGSGGEASVLIGRSGGVSASIAASMSATAGAPVDFSEVQSLELVIERVEAHRTSGGNWIAIDVEPVTIDLASIGEGSSVEVAGGSLPEGAYNTLRLYLSSATITFANDVSVGGTSYLADTPYELDIPSSENNGLRIPTAHFTVGAGEETVLVLFDPAGTTASIGATGSGRVRMSPVLREADEFEEDEAEEDAEEEESDDGESGDEGSGSASVLVGATAGVSSSILGGDIGVGIAGSVVPGGKVDPADVTSLRLAVCEIRAIRTGPKGDDSSEEGEGDEGSEGEEGAEGESDDDGEGSDDGIEEDGDAEADETPACQGNAGGAAWTRIPLEETEFDLFALGDGEVAEIGFGELPAGRYRNVRLYLTGAWITFGTDMTFGSTTILAGEEVPLRIPGADNSGLKIPASHFEIAADQEEALLMIFDRSSVSSVKKTGQGFQISPILREATPAEEEDAAESEAEGEEEEDSGASGD